MRWRARSAAGRTAAYLFAGHAVVLGASLVLNVLSAHALGPAGRGELALLLQVAYLLGVCAVAGVDRAYPAASPAPGRAAEREVRRLLAPGVGALAAVAAGGAALTAATRGAGAAYPLLVGLMAVAVVGLTAVRTGAAAAGTGRRYLGANLASQGLLVVGALALAAADEDRATAWLALYAGAPLLVVAALWARRPAAAAPAGAAPRLRRVRAEGRRVLPGALAAFGTLRADRLLLPLLASVPALGVYAVAAAFAELCVMPVHNYVDAHLATWRRRARAGTLDAGRLLGAAAAYAVGAAALVAGAGAAFITVALPPDFGAAARVLPLLALAAAAWAFSRVAAGLALARGAAAGVSAVDAATLAVTVGGHVALIPRYGLWGAGGAALGGYLCAAVGTGVLARAPRAVALAAPRCRPVTPP